MLTLVLGLAAVIRPLPVGARVRRYLAGAAVLGGVAALVVPGGVGRVGGLGLVLLYVTAVVVVWTRERRVPAIGELAELEEDNEEPERRPGGLVLVSVGIVVMASGGWVAVLGAERLVLSLGVGESVVGLSIVALATTAELLALAISAHRHQVSELAVAGIVGSVGYNATVTLGVAALARPIVTEGIRGPAWFAAGLTVSSSDWEVGRGSSAERAPASSSPCTWRI
jgi:cation:H+ antiporter